MALLHLARHGRVQNPGNIVYGRLPGWKLSDEGLAEARTLAESLAEQPIVAVYSSPLERAMQTAELVAAAVAGPLRVREDLTEWGLGLHWQGMAWADLPHRRPDEWRTYIERPQELTGVPETLRQLADRMSAAIRKIAALHPGDEVAVVSHSDPIKAAVLALTGDDLSRIHEEQLPTAGRITLDLSAEPARITGRWPVQ